MNMPLLISEQNINLYPRLKRYWNILEETEKKFVFDPEGLWSYTPQLLATEIASQIPGNHMIDLFCGVGGNAIGFAKAGKRIDAVDSCHNRLSMAKINSLKANVFDKINFHYADAHSFISNLSEVDTIFMDPPWGGEKHRYLAQFCFKHFFGDIKALLWQCFEIAKDVILKLPFNFNTDELQSFGRKVKIVSHYIPEYDKGRPFFISAYFLSQQPFDSTQNYPSNSFVRPI